MVWGSTVPAAVDGILTALRGSTDLTGVRITDGPGVGNDGSLELLAVGYSGEDDRSVTATVTAEGFASQPNREDYQIWCAASAGRGDDDLAGARARAYTLYGAAGAALAADRTLAGVVMRAMPGQATLRQARTSRGVVATVVFAVTVTAYTQT